MVIAALVLSIISISMTIILAIVSLLVLNYIMMYMNNINNINNDNNDSGDSDDSGDIEFQKGFDKAREYFWYILQLTIYELYRNMDILDYDSLMDSIKDTMETLLSNDELRTEAIQELNKYFDGENE